MMVLDGFWGLLEDVTHLIISIGLFNWKIKIIHGCTLHGSVLVHTPFPLRHSLQLVATSSWELGQLMILNSPGPGAGFLLQNGQPTSSARILNFGPDISSVLVGKSGSSAPLFWCSTIPRQPAIILPLEKGEEVGIRLLKHLHPALLLRSPDDGRSQH